jgi:hypothetical protein
MTQHARRIRTWSVRKAGAPAAVRTVWLRLAALSFTLLVGARIAVADESMRCGNWIVSMPVTVEELLRKCGEPLKKEVTTEDVRVAGRSGVGSRIVGTTTTEKWTYNLDGKSLPMIVTVVDGQVTRIDRAE